MLGNAKQEGARELLFYASVASPFGTSGLARRRTSNVLLWNRNSLAFSIHLQMDGCRGTAGFSYRSFYTYICLSWTAEHGWTGNRAELDLELISSREASARSYHIQTGDVELKQPVKCECSIFPCKAQRPFQPRIKQSWGGEWDKTFNKTKIQTT